MVFRCQSLQYHQGLELGIVLKLFKQCESDLERYESSFDLIMPCYTGLSFYNKKYGRFSRIQV